MDKKALSQKNIHNQQEWRYTWTLDTKWGAS